MKNLILIILMFSNIHLFSQETSKKELREQKQDEEFNSIVALINSKKFEFSANQALPVEGPSIDLSTNPNQLIIKDDSLFCDMPFFGRAFNIDLNDRGGFHFSGIIENFKKTENIKKKNIDLKFKLKNSSDSYQFLLSITRSKSASLTITSNNRASIAYWGKITDLEKIRIP
jgi:hypothetical protein